MNSTAFRVKLSAVIAMNLQDGEAGVELSELVIRMVACALCSTPLAEVPDDFIDDHAELINSITQNLCGVEVLQGLPRSAAQSRA